MMMTKKNRPGINHEDNSRQSCAVSAARSPELALKQGHISRAFQSWAPPHCHSAGIPSKQTFLLGQQVLLLNQLCCLSAVWKPSGGNHEQGSVREIKSKSEFILQGICESSMYAQLHIISEPKMTQKQNTQSSGLGTKENYVSWDGLHKGAKDQLLF